MRRLTARVLWSGGLSGAAAGLAFFMARRSMPRWFTSDPAVVDALLSGWVWMVLAVAQPLNGLLFVFDGLMYSTQVSAFPSAARFGLLQAGLQLEPMQRRLQAHPALLCRSLVTPHASHPRVLHAANPLQAFRYVRDYMALGFVLVFLPALALEAFFFPSLANIWLAKAALNVWRLAGAAHLIYWRFLPRFGLDREQRQGTGGGTDAAAAAAEGGGADMAAEGAAAAQAERRADDGP